ncbi:hypothetical protein N665_0014s0012 [Sinapis alba]|nr:hypothetical protein N665_0014s0012 [Sinapis alba]
MASVKKDPIVQVESTCGSLLYELQVVGETETDRDKMLLELERECLEVYRRKVDQANRSRAQLRQAIADAQAQLAAISSALGERPVHIRQSDQSVGSLKQELGTILPELEEMQKRQTERRSQFMVVLEEIENITNDIKGQGEHVQSKPLIDETDLSMRKLEKLHCHLQALQKEKSDRVETIRKHLCTLYSHCTVLGMDFNEVVSQVNSTLTDPEGPRSLSDHTIKNLDAAVQKLREVKIQRMKKLLTELMKLQDLATTMLELWNLMDTPIEEQQEYQHITCNIAASEHEVTAPNSLSEDFIKYVEDEVARLDEVKASKMKELVLKKRSELEDICRKTHMLPVSDSAIDQTIVAIESGIVDATLVLEHLEQHISKIKEEALSRKDILEKVEKWLSACDEESWLEEYNRDDNRYNAGRGAHLTLKRAEKARNLVNKLPGMVEALASKTIVWEQEKGIEFLYDGIRLLSMLEEYNLLRQEREEEHRRQRDHKKLQGQLIAEQEALYGSKPSPSKPLGGKKAPRMSTGGAATNRRLSLGAGMHQTPKPNKKADQRQIDGALSTVRRGLDVAGLPSRKQSMNPCEQLQSPLVRKPFSPISTTVVASKANIATPQQLLPNPKINPMNEISAFATPVKNNNSIRNLEEEKMMMTMMQTPKNVAAMIPIPSTPATISVPMQTAATPLNNTTARLLPEKPEVVEYSFEERRLAFMLQSESLIHV